ncbi:hypothetical protein ESCO_001280 [Escovopsis weberi]|uniref:Uncharacterized protein n=1 Tax=Escovopsis weberi TaxID=150374 RepID=A0A0M8N266_ESCWE|nr:hypothetical protein ESCO_001280 [Escovopsis weberi]
MISRRITSSLPARQGAAALALAKSRPPARSPAIRFSSTAPAPVTIVDGSFWRSLVPKPLRRDGKAKGKGAAKKDWNPATYFIVMFLFIGSMSIQMLALRHQTERYLRQSSVRIAQLREVVRKIQDGEDVDVEKMLGTGDPQQEAEWEEVLQAIERDEAMRKPRQQQQQEEEEKKGNGSKDSACRTKPASHGETQHSTSGSGPAPAKTKPAHFGSFF